MPVLDITEPQTQNQQDESRPGEPQRSERQYYTPEEYLALETAAETRSEYCNGDIIPMTGGTTNHNRIARNLSAWLHFASKDDDDYENFIGDVRLWIPEAKIYTYPDVMVVVAGAVEYHNNRTDTICNPSVIIEVLSPSTEACNRSEKFAAYRTLPSFQEYVLIHQTHIQVEHYTKQAPKRWLLQDLDSEDSQIQFASLPFAIALDDLYRKVQFADEVMRW
jgi:Uma2 family endonuclease